MVDAPIQEGDLFGHVFGHDPRGYVRGLGLGPTPTSLGMDGWHKCTSTKVQRAKHGRDKAAKEVSELKGIVEQLIDEVLELRGAVKGTRGETPQPGLRSTPEQASNPTPPATV